MSIQNQISSHVLGSMRAPSGAFPCGTSGGLGTHRRLLASYFEMPRICIQCLFPVSCRGLLCLLLLSAGRIEHAKGFMKPTGSSVIANGRTAAPFKGELWRYRIPEAHPLNERGRSISRCLRSGGRGRQPKALPASSGGEQSIGSTGEDIVYAQDVLDKAWRSKRRVPTRGKSWPLGQKLLDAFVTPKTGVFVDDRAFMESTLDNVVRVYCTHNLPSWSLPWQRLKQEQSTSTGFVIDGRRIITNAHSVEYSTMIQVRGRGSDKKYQATCHAVGEECDLAILTVEDESFWEETSPLSFGELPELTDQVSVIGYPVGGECISITAGVVSRVEMTMYAQAEQELLSIQIDAAINPGNSGGPVVNDDGEVVGVAFQSLEGDDVENIGYVVPVNVLEHFLEDVRRHGKYLGFPRMGVIQQRLENPALRQSLKMSEGQTGVLVTGIEPMAPAVSMLRKGDVVMKVDGISVANDGSIPFRSGERVSLRYYMSQLFPGDKMVVELLREEKVVSVTVPLFVSEFLCPIHFGGQPPSYFVLGGLVFTVMSNPYLETELDNHASGLAHLLSIAQYGRKQKKGEDIVILTQVLAHEVNVGYEGMSNLQLLGFNGVRIESLAHLVRLADGNTEPFLRFDFFPDKVVVLDAAGVPAATDQICRENSIPASRSADMLQGPDDADGGMGIVEAVQAPAVNGAPQPSITEMVPTTFVDAQKRRVAGWRVNDPSMGSGRGSRLRSVTAAAVRRLSERVLWSRKCSGMRGIGRRNVGACGDWREDGGERRTIFGSDCDIVCKNSRDIWRWRRRRYP